MSALEPARIVVINGGVSEQSTSRMLAERTAQATIERMRGAGREASVSFIDLAPLAAEVAGALVTSIPSERISAAIETLATADGIIVATPVYKAGVSGLVKSFFDILDNDLLVAKPVVLAATAGTARHAMVVDDQLRPLLAFMRTIPVPTSLFADPDDWAAPAFTKRIKRAASELAALLIADVAGVITANTWGEYNHTFAGNAAKAKHGLDDIDFNTDLMRLATGQR